MKNKKYFILCQFISISGIRQILDTNNTFLPHKKIKRIKRHIVNTYILKTKQNKLSFRIWSI